MAGSGGRMSLWPVQLRPAIQASTGAWARKGSLNGRGHARQVSGPRCLEAPLRPRPGVPRREALVGLLRKRLVGDVKIVLFMRYDVSRLWGLMSKRIDPL